MERKNLFCLSIFLQFAFLLVGPGCAAAQVQQPEALIGHPVGADYKVARYETIREYFEHVADNSSRVNVREIGVTTEGRDMFIAEITDDASPARLEEAMGNQKLIADPRLIKDEKQEQELIADTKVVVLINCNLHSTEIASSQMAMELLHDLATGTSPEIQEILKRIIVVLIPSANPDGLDKVIDWYERSLGKPWEGTGATGSCSISPRRSW
ncbi:MAG: M14 family zinc carboxypeptidase [Planctomycetota bacterium]|jgi:murein tripeptide amidase MpaA